MKCYVCDVDADVIIPGDEYNAYIWICKIHHNDGIEYCKKRYGLISVSNNILREWVMKEGKVNEYK